MNGHSRCPLLAAAVLGALAGAPQRLSAQWTVKPGGWFMSNGFNVGKFPDRYSNTPGATGNSLDKRDWGLYFIYGWKEGLSVGLGQGFAHLEETRGGATSVTNGFTSTGLFVMKRITHGKGGILSIQPRVDLPLFYDTEARPVTGPVTADAEVRLLYGTGYGAFGKRGFVSTSAGVAPWRTGADEVRADLTVGLDVVPKVLVMGQMFNVWGYQAGGLSYSASKLGGSFVYKAVKGLGIQLGYAAGIAGKNTAREQTWSLSIWLNHDAPDRQSGGK